MIVNNKDTLIIKLDHPLIGVSSIDSITIDGTGSYSVYLRISKDNGITWSDWGIFNKSITLDPQQFALIEYKIIANSDNVDIKSIDAKLNYTKPTVPIKWKEISLSRFVSFYEVEVILWTLNVYNKIYKAGIIPNYIDRSEDFACIWINIIHLQALKIYYNICLGEILQDRKYAKEYAESKGLYIGSNNSIDEIFKSLKYFYQQISQRGSLDCFKYSGEERGEVLRLLNSNDYDENTVGLMSVNESGWLLDFSSPLEEKINPGLHNLIKKVYKTSASLTEKSNVNYSLSYKISFYLKSTASGTHNIDLGLNYYDSLDNVISQNYFVQNHTISVVANDLIKVDCILFGYDKGSVSNSNVGIGKYLQLNSKNINKIAPILKLSNNLSLDKIEISILDLNTFIYLYSEKILYLYLTNNTIMSEEKLKDIIESNFTPISTNVNITLL